MVCFYFAVVIFFKIFNIVLISDLVGLYPILGRTLEKWPRNLNEYVCIVSATLINGYWITIRISVCSMFKIKHLMNMDTMKN